MLRSCDLCLGFIRGVTEKHGLPAMASSFMHMFKVAMVKHGLNFINVVTLFFETPKWLTSCLYMLHVSMGTMHDGISSSCIYVSCAFNPSKTFRCNHSFDWKWDSRRKMYTFLVMCNSRHFVSPPYGDRFGGKFAFSVASTKRNEYGCVSVGDSSLVRRFASLKVL